MQMIMREKSQQVQVDMDLKNQFLQNLICNTIFLYIYIFINNCLEICSKRVMSIWVIHMIGRRKLKSMNIKSTETNIWVPKELCCKAVMLWHILAFSKLLEVNKDHLLVPNLISQWRKKHPYMEPLSQIIQPSMAITKP